MNGNPVTAYPAVQTTYAQEQEHLRRLRHKFLEHSSSSSDIDSVMQTLGVVTLANVAGLLIEEYPHLRYFSYSVVTPVEGVQIILPGSFFDADEKSLSEEDSESLSALLCELVDDDATIFAIAGFTKVIDALKISQWEPMDGIESGLNILEGVDQ
jgi:hypothetical protein